MCERSTMAASVFDGVVGEALLATGRTVDIVDARPDDLEAVRTFYDELGDTSTYYRFFGIRRYIPEDELRAVVSHDVPRHITLLAKMDGRLIGIGEAIVGDDPLEAEVAFTVADDHHHEGVATLLLERLAVVGRRRGLQRLMARTLPGNADMRLVFRTVGLTRHSDFDGGEVHVTLDLSSLDELEAAAAQRHELAARAAEALVRPYG